VQIKDSVTIVAGAGAGIGAALAQSFAATGAKIVVADIDAAGFAEWLVITYGDGGIGVSLIVRWGGVTNDRSPRFAAPRSCRGPHSCEDLWLNFARGCSRESRPASTLAIAITTEGSHAVRMSEAAA
jgi:hypothetical protein